MCSSSSSGCPQCFAEALNLLALAALSSSPSPWLSQPSPTSCCAETAAPGSPPTTGDAPSPAEELRNTFHFPYHLGGVRHARALLTEVWAVSPGTPCTFPHRCSCLHSHPALLPSLPHMPETPNHLVINNTAFSPCPSKNPTPSAALKIPCRSFSIIT